MDIDDLSNNITVILSATKFCPSDTNMQADNIPICIVQMGIAIFGFNEIERKKYLRHLAETAKKMAGLVKINSELRTVIIKEYENSENGEEILVEYRSKRPKLHVYEHEFFSRWDECHTLSFEYQVSDIKTSKDIFAVRGFWTDDRWHDLDIYPSTVYAVQDLKK